MPSSCADARPEAMAGPFAAQGGCQEGPPDSLRVKARLSADPQGAFKDMRGRWMAHFCPFMARAPTAHRVLEQAGARGCIAGDRGACARARIQDVENTVAITL